MYQDYSVTWNEVKGIVDKLLDGDELMAMGDVQRAVKQAWDIIFDDRCRRYGVEYDDNGCLVNEGHFSAGQYADQPVLQSAT